MHFTPDAWNDIHYTERVCACACACVCVYCFDCKSVRACVCLSVRGECVGERKSKKKTKVLLRGFGLGL